ncbi:MAG TPA: hypothetical protein DCM87_04635 [Planctomycetes bacterium]|nr:hypothetical protein [Planctomycetota bacterium]
MDEGNANGITGAFPVSHAASAKCLPELGFARVFRVANRGLAHLQGEMDCAMTNEISNQELIERARENDRAAFEQLVERHREELDRFVASRLGAALRSVTEISDIRQEVFLKAFRSLPAFSWEGEQSFFRWLAGIANNLILHLARRGRLAERAVLQAEVPGSGVSPSRHLRREERFDRLEEALRALSADHRQVILLTRIQGLPIEEAARRMGRSPKAARQLLWRALRDLRHLFGETGSLHLPERSLGTMDGDDA